jgi:hypothetical protein
LIHTGRGRTGVHYIDIQADYDGRAANPLLDPANYLRNAQIVDVECVNELEASGDVVIEIGRPLFDVLSKVCLFHIARLHTVYLVLTPA